MTALKPLFAVLQRSLRILVLRRALAWAACGIILLVLGSALAHLSGDSRLLRLGLLLVGVSALPAVLLWPVPEKRILDRFRRIDEGMVFEAYLEAEPGPVRDILRQLAAEKAAALPFAEAPPEPRPSGLRALWGVALLCLVLAEGISFLVQGRSLAFAPPRPVVAGRGERLEEQGFSDYATEDPAARRNRHERARERAEAEGSPGGDASLGAPGAARQGAASSRRAPRAYDEPEEAAASDPEAARKPGEPDLAGGTPATPSGEAPGRGGPKGPEAAPGHPPPGGMRTPEQDAERGGKSMTAGRTGQGYEHTADTKVPSPLLDYRSRFESRYAERTGRHLAASGRMGFGELREFQRRYFDSFTLRADVGTADDPYVALLKRRWAERKGGAW